MDENKKEDEQHLEPTVDETASEPTEAPKKESDNTPTIEEALKAEAEPSTEAPVFPQKPVATKGRFKRFLGTKKGKVITILGSIVLIVAVLLAVPFTRYKILGTFLKKNSTIVVVDSTTSKPVTDAEISLGSLSAKTDSNGKAIMQDVPVGEYKLKVTKNYYKSSEQDVAVPIFGNTAESKIDLVATGRQVQITLTDKITKKPLEKATIATSDTSATTDADGLATIVLPADQETMQATVKSEGYNQTDVQIKITDSAADNVFSLSPEGTVYFLSKQTGKINVMKSNLDGSNANVVVAGTGNESDGQTALLAARDWKFMALLAKRKADAVAQLHVVDAATNSLKTIDEGNADFKLVGWSDHKFLYVVTRNDKKEWEDKRQALKSYDADADKLTVLDETYGTGTDFYTAQYEILANPYILEGKVIYTKSIYRGQVAQLTPNDKKSSIVVATPSSGQKQTVQEFAAKQSAGIEAKLYAPQEVYFRVGIDNAPVAYYEYESGAVKSTTSNDEKFYNTFYPTYLYSPDGQKTFWHEPRNGKNALFIGDKNGKDGRELAQQSEYTAYGWFSDKYILLSKNGSELYIAGADQPMSDAPLKIANYHKPTLNFAGYGYGYGGQ